jgi:hypothetical protein
METLSAAKGALTSPVTIVLKVGGVDTAQAVKSKVAETKIDDAKVDEIKTGSLITVKFLYSYANYTFHVHLNIYQSC